MLFVFLYEKKLYFCKLLIYKDMEEIHIGKNIKKLLEQKGIKMKWFCEQMHCHRNTAYGIFERAWVDSYTLMKISIILDYDFFADLSVYYSNYKKQSNSTDLQCFK